MPERGKDRLMDGEGRSRQFDVRFCKAYSIKTNWCKVLARSIATGSWRLMPRSEQQDIRRVLAGGRPRLEPSSRRRRPAFFPQGLQVGQPRFGVAEVVELHAHAVHDRQVQAAQLAVVVAGVEVVRATGRSSSVPPRPPAVTTGSFMLSCFQPDHMFERNSRQELSSTVPSPSGIASSFLAR